MEVFVEGDSGGGGEEEDASAFGAIRGYLGGSEGADAAAGYQTAFSVVDGREGHALFHSVALDGVEADGDEPVRVGELELFEAEDAAVETVGGSDQNLTFVSDFLLDDSDDGIAGGCGDTADGRVDADLNVSLGGKRLEVLFDLGRRRLDLIVVIETKGGGSGELAAVGVALFVLRLLTVRVENVHAGDGGQEEIAGADFEMAVVHGIDDVAEAVALGELVGIDNEAFEIAGVGLGVESAAIADGAGGVAFALVAVVALVDGDFEVEGGEEPEGRVLGAEVVELFGVGAEDGGEEGGEIAASGGTAEGEVRELAAFEFGGSGPGEHFTFVADGHVEAETVAPDDGARRGEFLSCLNERRTGVGTATGVAGAVLDSGDGLDAGVAGGSGNVVEDLLADLVEEGLREGYLGEGANGGRE